jgi:hypothetical protein
LSPFILSGGLKRGVHSRLSVRFGWGGTNAADLPDSPTEGVKTGVIKEVDISKKAKCIALSRF